MPYVLKYNGTVYYYITNLQGDVISIVDGSGAVVASYSYDPYGNVLTATGTLAETNPLRYRGYVYDTETRLYYLQSRYYDPSIGRFINADSYASTGQGVLGHNMFAYCNNSPANFCDPGGNYGIINSNATARNSGSSAGIISDEDRRKRLRQQGRYFFNSSEEAVLLNEEFAFYKGVPVIKVSSMETSGLSLYIIFLGSDVKSVNTVRHEYGHTMQLAQLGLRNYLVWVGLPSKYYFDQTMNEKYSWDEYYERPWELIADVYGGVNVTHSASAYRSAEIYWFLAKYISCLLN